MRQKIIISTFLVFIALSIKCSKSDFSIRIKNQYQEQLNVMVGTVKFFDILSGQTTAYKPIDKGQFNVVGGTSSGKSIWSSIKLDGSGTHKWTVTIESTGELTLNRDN